MGNLRSEIHEKAKTLAADKSKIEGFLKDRIRVVSRSIQDQIDSQAKSVPIETVKVWLGFLNPQLGLSVDGEVVVTQERISPAQELQMLPEPTKDKANLLTSMLGAQDASKGAKTEERKVPSVNAVGSSRASNVAK